MRVFDFESYRDFVKSKIKFRPNGGRGELIKIAKHARIHTTTLSQILNGARDMSLEQGVSLCTYFGMSDQETRFFLALIQWDRAGSPDLKKIFRDQLDEMRDSSGELVNMIPRDGKISDQDRATFYSHWYYSAIRVLSSIDQYQTPEAIADHLQLPIRLVNEAIQFLLQTGLCRADGNHIGPGPKYTHLEASSPLASRHHANWRIKVMERYPRLEQEEFSYTSPMSLSKQDAARLRERLVTLVKDANQIREQSPSETAYCLNIDWAKF